MIVPPWLFMFLAYYVLCRSALAFDEAELYSPWSQDSETIKTQVSEIVSRQITTPPSTSQPICPQFDGYFYVTPKNSTFQLQCRATYTGSVLGYTDTGGYAECIDLCEQLNNAAGPGSCVGLSFNGTSNSNSGTCTGYSQISFLSETEDGSVVYDSALLIYGPDGTQYATPDETQAPASTNLPLQSSTSGSTASTSTTTPTRSLSLPSLSLDPTTTAISISFDGPRPIETMPIASSSGSPPVITSTTTSVTTSGGLSLSQQTYTNSVQYTIYQVLASSECFNDPTRCSELGVTSTITGHRTQISCFPGSCAGIMTVNATAALSAPFCVIAS